MSRPEGAGRDRVGRVEVRPVKSWMDRRRFQRLPWTIYAGDPNWVPPILADERALLGWRKHPFYDNAESVSLLAMRRGWAVGRLAVLVNRTHNRKYEDKVGFFGFFECVDDVEVAGALFDAGQDWLAQRGMTIARGPVNPSLNYTCGLLIDGFDSPPCFLMTYNKPYYGSLIEACGFHKSQDLYSYEMDAVLLAEITARYNPAVVAALERPELSVRNLDKKNFRREIEKYLDIYNRSLDGTWGFTPLQPREMFHIAGDMRYVIIPEFAILAEVDGHAAGAVLALLDYNQIIKHINGRLFPFGVFKVLMGRRKITAARAMAMTMVPGYQRSGLGIVLMDRLVEAAKQWGIRRWEFSWVLESNSKSRGTLERSGMKIAKTYRLYDKTF
jgi:GNAT superfamily N-acetyltransferase